METGISIYAGLGYKQKENIELIKFAGQRKFPNRTRTAKIFLTNLPKL